MKNFKYIFAFAICFNFLFIGAQEKSEQVAENSELSADTKVQSKIKFGSKEHRSIVEGAPDKIESTENILLKTCLALAVVIGIILGLYAILKKVNKKFLNTGTESPLRIQNKLVIDGKNYLALVRVYEEELLVSIGPNGANLLSKYALVDKEDAEGTEFEEILNSQGKSVIPLEPEKIINSIELKSIKDLANEKAQ